MTVEIAHCLPCGDRVLAGTLREGSCSQCRADGRGPEAADPKIGLTRRKPYVPPTTPASESESAQLAMEAV